MGKERRGSTVLVDAGFVGEDLRVRRAYECGVLGGKGERFVHGIGVEGSAAAR